MNISARIEEFLDQRGWSVYRLGKESGIAQSTLSHIFKKDSDPSFSTLEIICSALGITMSEFFSDGECVCLSEEQKSLLRRWAMLTNAQKQLIYGMMDNMK